MIKSEKLNIYTIEQTKVAFSNFDDKRYILDDGYTTLAHGQDTTIVEQVILIVIVSRCETFIIIISFFLSLFNETLSFCLSFLYEILSSRDSFLLSYGIYFCVFIISIWVTWTPDSSRRRGRRF